MKCPFAIPVEKIDDYQDHRGKKYYRIIDVAKCTIVEGVSNEYADYIVQAINSHEKLLESIEYALGCGIMTETVCKKLEQALNEAEEK